MTRRLLNVGFSAAAALLLTAGCGLMAADEHTHDHGHAHADTVALGTVTLGAVVATVDGAGAPAAGKEWHVSVTLPAGTAAPKAIRLWVGIENGRGSEKAKAESDAAHPGVYAAHVDVPAPMPVGSKLWVSLEPTTGEAVKGSLAVVAAAAKGDDHKGHDHKGHDHKGHDHK